jgi:transposase
MKSRESESERGYTYAIPNTQTPNRTFRPIVPKTPMIAAIYKQRWQVELFFTH